jgi:two-component system sensor histidine kinase RegB
MIAKVLRVAMALLRSDMELPVMTAAAHLDSRSAANWLQIKSANYTRLFTSASGPESSCGKTPHAGDFAARGHYARYNGAMNPAPNRAPAYYNPSADNLRSLLIIRSVALLGQIGVLAYVLLASRTTEDITGLTASLVVLALITVASLWRCGSRWPVTDQEFFAQLLIDVFGWTSLMYFSGGANNPFVSYYIVPLVVSAAVLPWRYTWLITGLSLTAYSLLLYYYLPFPMFTPHANMGHGNNVHILGMWFNFLFSAGLITYFVVRMAATLRRQEQEAVARKEDSLRNDQIMAVAGLAAGTAHELGTPLSTITVLLEELSADASLSDQAQADCALMQAQVAQCKSILGDLSRTAELTSTDEKQRLPLKDWVGDTLRHWAVRRPQVVYEFDCSNTTPSPLIEVDLTLGQALENLLNNAANAGGGQVEITLDWGGEDARIDIRDHGPGVPAELLQKLGKPVVQVSESGLGLGLLLTHATIERYGGHIELRNAPDGGTLATLSLPLELLEPRE